ncbi:MAG: hypothetical protein ACOQNV_02730 [Mycoplasmoidaceae bacterium]
MKLFKKLLPIIGSVSVASIVVPLGTSCTPNDTSGWLKADYDLDEEAEGFVKLSQEELPAADENLATRDYAWAIYNNKQTVYNDYRDWLTILDRVVFDLPYALYMLIPIYLPISMVYSDVTMMRGRISNFSVNPSLYTVTYDLEVKMNVELGVEIPLVTEYGIDPSIVFAVKADFNAHYDKCPFFVGRDYVKSFIHSLIPDLVEDKGAACILNMSRMIHDPIWSETLGFDVEVETYNETIDFGLGFNSSRDLYVNAKQLAGLVGIDNILMFVGQLLGGWSSYYYSEMEWPSEGE